MIDLTKKNKDQEDQIKTFDALMEKKNEELESV